MAIGGTNDYYVVMRLRCRKVAEEKGLLNGNKEHDERVIRRLMLHFTTVAA